MLQLVIPDMSHKEQWEEIMREWKIPGESLAPWPLFRGEDFNEFLDLLKKDRVGDNLEKTKRTLFFLSDSEGYIYGGIEIRHNISHKNFIEVGGHIGYGIRPSERRKGYAKEILRLGLLEAKKIGILNALITCSDDNIGSYKTIESNGGIFERFAEKDGVKKRRYWIDLYKDEKELLISLELELHTPECRHTPKRIDELLADDFFECGKTGKIFGKKECLEWLPAEKEKKFTASEVSAHIISSDIVQIRYFLEIVGDGEELTRSFRTSLWRNTGSGWQMFFHQGTLL